MEIWHYDRTTGEVVGTGTADPNPEEEGAWLLPAWSTDVPPPDAQEGKARVWLGGSWNHVADHRGETWWRVEAEFNNEPVTIGMLGDPAQHGLTNIEPPAPPAPPIVVSAVQIRRALNQFGLRAAVEAWVQGADQDTRDNWQFESSFSRLDSPVVDALEAYGRPAEHIDELFELAKTM